MVMVTGGGNSNTIVFHPLRWQAKQ